MVVVLNPIMLSRLGLQFVSGSLVIADHVKYIVYTVITEDCNKPDLGCDSWIFGSIDITEAPRQRSMLTLINALFSEQLVG